MVTADVVSLQIDGMHCGSCVARVDKALRSVPGVRSAAVNLTTATARVEGAPETGALVRAVESVGYKARVLGDMSAEMVREIGEEKEEESRRVLNRLWVGALAGVPVVAADMAMPWFMASLPTAGMVAFG